ncbi:High-affinity branched-chain amino acid transport ATP-binding protein LivF [bioreactor metagenome]|uniref:High-affinity branched-chain amino acid transport ATP-binding protein LivF n=1 Tax=bioreactor metagenome TaxID=1076179 RepID=A0A645EZE4_9ZZZZ
MVDTMLEAIEVINKEGVTICLVEQNAQLALQMADRAYALETGCIVMEGTGEQLLNDDNVKNVYLGL